MRTVATVLALVVGLLFMASPADAKKKKSKSDDLELQASYKRGKKRSASDPVLLRYGKKAEYVAVSDYDERSKKRSRKAAKSAKAKQPKRTAAVEEEILVIEEDQPVKKKPAKQAKKAKKAKKTKPTPSDEITITEGW